ncbi:hypothetical protein JCM10449v2_006232 [Rhodotorula kratochvilovae]
MTAIQTRSSASTPARAERPRRERQTRLQEHLRAVKPGSRSSSPAGKKPVAVSTSATKTVPKALASSSRTPAPADEPEPSTASGRPRRRAAAKVVMQEVESSSEEDGDDVDETEEDESVEDEQVEPLRSSTRSAKKRSPADSDDDLAPQVQAAGRTTGRKMPAQQVQQASSPSPRKKRAREPSSLDIERMNEAEVQGRLAREKSELMARLAPLGIIPQDHVLDQALRAMSKSNEQLSVESFMRTLASLDTNVSPVQRPGLPQLAISVPPPAKKVTFSTLESPSTPSSVASPTCRFPSPPQTAAASAFPPSHAVAAPTQFYTSPPSHAVPHARPPPAAMRPGPHLNPISRSFSAPNIPTLRSIPAAPLPAPTALAASASSNSLFGAAAGMGRVATRRGTFGGLGPDPRQQQQPQQQPIAPSPSRASFNSPAPPPPAATAPLSSSLLPAFAFGAAAPAAKPVRPRLNPATTAPMGAPNRLTKLQSWLAEDDDGTSEDEEDKRPGAAAANAEASAMLKAAAATSKVAAAVPAAPVMQLVDAPPSDDEREEEVQIRVGGKSVQVLRQRRLDGGAQQEQQDTQGMSTRMSTRASSAKGKGRAVLECLCGAPAQGHSAAVQCIECDVAFHLACLNAVSAKQLASPWTCSRCVVADEQQERPPHAGPDSGRTTPQLVNKRVRIGTNTTPHVYQEPTFVESTPVPAPRENNFSHCADMALAPSPTQSPVRRFASAAVPTSPVPSAAKLPIPVTPQFGEATIVRAPGDYSPTSPQNYRTRAGRTRMVSGGAFLSGEWLNSWDAPGDEPTPQQASTPVSGGLASLVDDEWHLPAWSDVTMTPSRALSSATPGATSSASSSVWDTPFAHASPHAHLRRANSSFTPGGPSAMPFRTPSQDFLGALSRDASQQQHHQTAPAQVFAQRLFGQEQPHHQHQAQPHYQHHPYQQQQHYPAPLDSSSPSRPPSPLNPRRLPPHPHHQRKPSLGDGLANPWLGGALAHERMALSASMKPSHSAPGGGRFLPSSASSAASVEQQMLDDLLV